MKIKPCVQCGECCKSGVSCIFGQILFDITEDDPTSCPALEYEKGLYWCGLIRNPIKWFAPLVGDVGWKCEAMADITRIYIGIGAGCCMSPSKEEIIIKMKERFAIRKKPFSVGTGSP
ncbi:hypothetical protein LCGC14_0416940 [marine sediment metagenome]|uniref:4Fe-4S ferredoxin-type domain-containing protein n=1 Tax=marine sediment metagenome TaxID=412755 RepID=A0A0F9SS95_9ZZZZ